MMDEPTLAEWLDRHHVNIIRTLAVLADGTSTGEYVHRSQFEATFPLGNLSPVASAYLSPDLNTLISDGTDPNLGHVICDLRTAAGEPTALCPRSTLKRLCAEARSRQQLPSISARLCFCLYADSVETMRANNYTAGPAIAPASRRIHRSYEISRYMNEVISRLEWKHIGWHSWQNTPARDQVALVLAPDEPLVLADHLMLTRIVMYEVAVDMDMAVTFMARPSANVWNSLNFDTEFDSPGGEPNFAHWVAGLRANLAATTCLGRPGASAWSPNPDGCDAPEAGVITSPDMPGRFCLAGGAANLNPYLVLAGMMAAGLAGGHIELPGRPEPGIQPAEPEAALGALLDNPVLCSGLGSPLVNEWVAGQRKLLVALQEHTTSGASSRISDWALQREFECF